MSDMLAWGLMVNEAYASVRLGRSGNVDTTDDSPQVMPLRRITKKESTMSYQNHSTDVDAEYMHPHNYYIERLRSRYYYLTDAVKVEAVRITNELDNLLIHDDPEAESAPVKCAGDFVLNPEIRRALDSLAVIQRAIRQLNIDINDAISEGQAFIANGGKWENVE